MNGRVLITGGFGYLGGRAARLLSSGSEYHVSIGTRRGDVQRPEWLSHGEIVKMDLADKASLRAACRGADHVVHLAAMNEIECAKDPEAAVIVNTSGTLRMLEAAVEEGVKRFIYLSTAHVYGSPLEGRITELTPTRPSHPYAATHRAAEDFVLSYHDSGKITGVVLRLSNGFGAPVRPGVDRWTLLVNDLCRQAATTKKLVLRSSGLQVRDFITLEDAARAIRHFISLPGGACADGLFNLGGEHTESVLDMAKRIAGRCTEVLGCTPVVERPEPAPGEVRGSLEYSIEKLKTTGFDLRGDFTGEIDATLRLSASTYGRETT